MHRRLYREIGDPEKLHRKDKTFVVQRRGGGGSGAPGTVGWETPRFFLNTNLLAQLPARLDNRGKSDTLLRLWVADPLGRESRYIRDLRLRLILHDAAAGPHIEKMNTSVKPDPPGPNRTPRALIALFKDINHLYNSSPLEGIRKRIDVRINNLLLEEPVVEDGWLVFRELDPDIFRLGNQSGRTEGDRPISQCRSPSVRREAGAAGGLSLARLCLRPTSWEKKRELYTILPFTFWFI